MFCPKCGNHLSETDHGFMCEQGQMEVVPELAQRLRDCYISKSREPHELRFNFREGGRWFCPGCGVLAEEIAGYVRCPQCKRSLNEFLRVLIERHPHSDGNGAWY